jgi:hypothetical protein
MLDGHLKPPVTIPPYRSFRDLPGAISLPTRCRQLLVLSKRHANTGTATQRDKLEHHALPESICGKDSRRSPQRTTAECCIQ